MPNRKKVTELINHYSLDRQNSLDRPNGSYSEKYRGRLGDLFVELEHMSCDTDKITPEMQSELETLRSRLLQIKREILKGDEPVPQPAGEKESANDTGVKKSSNLRVGSDPSARSLYEPEQIGFVYSEDKLQELHQAGKSPIIPSAISVPLTADGAPIGKVQITAPVDHEWTPADTDIISSVAQQASLQIQSLHLLSETERARAEAETASRQFMHEGWASYLDAIHKNERIGYSFDQDSVKPFSEKISSDAGVQEKVSVMGEQVGEIYLATDPEHPFTEPDRQIVSAIADQIAQQVENIRLLADASRARAEADAVIRRITRESWQSYTEDNKAELFSYAYDTNQVIPFTDRLPEDATLVLPLQVRGETIGQLAVTGNGQMTEEASDLASAIADQASMHLETLRLNEELQKRAAELLELDRLKSGFLANMSHELRTPLNSILGFADVVLEGLDGPLTPNMGTDIRLIQKNGQHLLHLINDVLDMAKISAGRMNLNPEKVRVCDIVEEVTSITSTLASEKGLSLFIEPDADMEVEIVADRTRLRQVMINLINNAIKFTEKGRIAIRFDRKENDKVIIRVKDSGIGIPPEKLEVIFQEFTQVDTSSTRKAGGTGLGLPISRHLVTMHGGSLWAESSGVPGEGSTFYVELPLVARIADVVEKMEK